MALPQGLANEIDQLRTKWARQDQAEKLRAKTALAWLEYQCEYVLKEFKTIQEKYSEALSPEMRFVIEKLTDALKRAREIERGIE